jgi:hypothetical protein
LQLRDMDPGLIEMFIDGTENALPDAGRLDGLGLGQGSVLFMLQRLGWCWDEHGPDITLSGEGLVASKESGDMTGGDCGDHLVTGGSPMTEGRHYWEVGLSWAGRCNQWCAIFVGAVRPGVNHDGGTNDGIDCPDRTAASSSACFIRGSNGTLCGNGKRGADKQGKFEPGDRIGVLLDLDAGWMRFYRNGKRCGPGYTEGVTGPLVRAASLYFKSDQVTVLPGAVPPEGAGAAGEPWDTPEAELNISGCG